MLPRMLFAAPDGIEICLSSSHVAVGCHAAHADDDCGDASTESGGDICLDFVADVMEATAHQPRGSIDIVTIDALAFADAFSELIQTALVPVPSATTTWGRSRVDIPPRFCARTHVCVLSPRC